MIRFGVTTFADMYPFPEEIFKAVDTSGLRAVISPAIFENINKSSNIKNAKKFLKHKHERIIPSLGPHSTYACTKEELEEVARISEEEKILIHIHAAETKDEIREIKKKYGMRPIEFLDSVGLLNERTLLAHVVWPSKREISLIGKRNSKVVHCPISNMKLASGIAPLPEMKGITVSVGSDGPCSNNNLNVFEEMKITALLHKVNTLDPTMVPANVALEMATINGAVSLGLENEIGSIEVGKRADIILVNFRKPHLTPVYNPISHLVYSCNGEDVDTVIVDGEILLRDGKFTKMNPEKIMNKVEKIKNRLVSTK